MSRAVPEEYMDCHWEYASLSIMIASPGYGRTMLEEAALVATIGIRPSGSFLPVKGSVLEQFTKALIDRGFLTATGR